MCGRPPSSWASSSVGQSWRLITAWSRVQVLPGPPKKHEGFGLRASFLLTRTVPCSSDYGFLCAACRRPVCRLQGSCWAVRVLLRLLLSPHRSPGWTVGKTSRDFDTWIVPSRKFTSFHVRPASSPRRTPVFSKHRMIAFSSIEHSCTAACRASTINFSLIIPYYAQNYNPFCRTKSTEFGSQYFILTAQHL